MGTKEDLQHEWHEVEKARLHIQSILEKYFHHNVLDDHDKEQLIHHSEHLKQHAHRFEHHCHHL